MKLQDTVEMMLSSDYKERFRGEYRQLVIRINGLDNMLSKWEKGELDFEPTCSKQILTKQLLYMINYQCVLEERAKIENIDLI